MVNLLAIEIKSCEVCPRVQLDSLRCVNALFLICGVILTKFSHIFVVTSCTYPCVSNFDKFHHLFHFIMLDFIMVWPTKDFTSFHRFRQITAWKVSIFRVVLVRIQSECRKLQTRLILNTNTFYAVNDTNWTLHSHLPFSVSKIRLLFVSKLRITRFPNIDECRTYWHELYCFVNIVLRW